MIILEQAKKCSKCGHEVLHPLHNIEQMIISITNNSCTSYE